MTRSAKDSIVLFLIVLVYVPFSLRSSSAFLDGMPSDIILEMNGANYEDWGTGTEQRLRDWLSTHPDDSEVIFTLGLLEKRENRYGQAEEDYRKAIQVSPVQ